MEKYLYKVITAQASKNSEILFYILFELAGQLNVWPPTSDPKSPSGWAISIFHCVNIHKILPAITEIEIPEVI